MAKINTEIIRKNYDINRVTVPSTYIVSTVYTSEDNIHLDFADTLLINNKSKTFIKNTVFDYDAPCNLTNIDVLNVNQSKINGTNVQINNTTNTFIVNTDNSQSTVESELLNTETLFNSRNQNQSFFNFPAPPDTKSFVVQPMMISNGLRTIWSEGKYGHINTENGSVSNLTQFYQYVPHDLGGQTIELTLVGDEILKNIENYHNGTIILKGSNCNSNINILNCSVKLVLSGFTFGHLNISNCNTVYLQDCSFDKFNTNNPLIEMNYTINPWQFKKGNLGEISNYSLSSSNSKIFIRNNTKNLNFNNFFVGIHANNNSLIYMIPLNTTVGILLKLNLSNYNLNRSSRPIFMLASNGSIINCNYYRKVNNEYVNKISANIVYPTNSTQAYKGNNSEIFTISNNLNYEEGNANYKRIKSLLFSLWSLINNSKVMFSLNGLNGYVDQTEKVSIPLFGLYQMAKPKMNELGSEWQLTNSQYHLLLGDENNHISAEDNDEWYMNVYNNGAILSNAQLFPNYNCPSTNNGYEGISVFPYSPAQPHLAHYFTKLPLEWTVEDITCGIVPNITTRTLVKQGTKNITQLKNNLTSFKGYINGVLRDIYVNPTNNSFYIYNDINQILYVTEEVTRSISYMYNNTDVSNVVNHFFTTSLSNDTDIHNIYYNRKTNSYFYFDKNSNLISNDELNQEINSKLISNTAVIQVGTPNIPVGTNLSFIYLKKQDYGRFINKLEAITNGWKISDGTWSESLLDPTIYNDTTQTFYNRVSISDIVNTIPQFTKAVAVSKKLTNYYDFSYNALSGEFYYDDNGRENYNLNNSVKNDLIYKYDKLIDITSLIKNKPTNSVAIASNIKIKTENSVLVYSIQDEFGNWSAWTELTMKLDSADGRLKTVTDALNPLNTKFYFIAETIDITNIMKHSNQHITTFSRAAGRNVDVYYDKKNDRFYYWANNRQQLTIIINTFTSSVKETVDGVEVLIPNLYFCDGMYDVTEIVNGEANQFVTYIDGRNRIVFYDFENKEFYYIDDNAQKVDCTSQIDVRENYIYHSTARTDISKVYTTTSWYFNAYLPGDGLCPIYWNETSGFYTKRNNENLTGYNMDDPANSGVIDDYIKQTVAAFTWKDPDNDNKELSATYYFETTPVNITPILVNSFKTTLNDVLQICYYNNDDNSFFYKDSLNRIIDVTNTIMNDSTFGIYATINNTTYDLTPIYKYPNYLCVQLGDSWVYFDDSNNILYTDQRTLIASQKTLNEDGDPVWVDGGDLSDDISYVMEDYFDIIDGVSACHTYYDYDQHTFKWKTCTVPKDNDEELEKTRDSWADVTNQVVSNLTWYYDGNNITDVVNGNTTFNADVDGQTKTVKFDSTTKCFRVAEDDVDVTYFITGALEVYYNQLENITDILFNPAYFTFNLSGKQRDIYYSPFLGNGGSFYITKNDVTDQFSSFITCTYKGKDITNAFRSATSFSGVYVDDNNDYITGTAITYNGLGWENDVTEGATTYTDDVTDYIEAKITSTKTFLMKYNFNEIFTDPTKYFEGIISTFSGDELINEEKRKIYWDSTLSKLYYLEELTKIFIDNVTKRVNYTGDNGQFFYYEEVEITNIINGNTFPFEVLREIYYDDKFSVYRYTNNNGLNVDISEDITPYIYDKYFYKKNGKYEDITNVVYYGNSFVSKWKAAYQTYFDYNRCTNMDVSAKELSTDFGQCFYYVSGNTRKYDNEGPNKGKHITSSTTMSTYYYGNLLDVSLNKLRQPFSTYIRGTDKNLLVYYDTYGGKSKNIGCYYYYKDNGDMKDITSDVSTYVRLRYYYNGMNITDTVIGSHFDFNAKQRMYFDQLTGRYYYLKGNLHVIPPSAKADKYNTKLVYNYTGKLDLTKMRQTGSTISAFYSFLNNDITTGKKFTFKINKNNELKWIKQGSTNVTDTIPTSYINGHYYLDNVDIKRVAFYGSKWFFTPIDGVTRRVYYRKWKKKLGKYDYYYKCNKKKILCTEKIVSHTNFYHDGDNINSMIRGASFKTKFEGTVLDGPSRRVYYDRNNKEYYYELREYLATDYVAANIWVDITNARDFSKKWSFLAWIGDQAREVFYDKKNLSYFYKDGKTNVNVANSEIENSNNIFVDNGDDRNYYHHLKLSTYLLWDNYLKVMVGDHIVDVYKNLDPKKEDGQDYYYVTNKVNVNHIVLPKVIKKYVYLGQSITKVIYPNPYSTINLDETAYTNKFNACVFNSGGVLTGKIIYYHPSAGFYYGSSTIKNSGWSSKLPRIVNDQICPYLNYFYYDRLNDVLYDISHNIDTKTPFAMISGDQTYQVYNLLLTTLKYVHLAPDKYVRNKSKNDTRRLHKRTFYYLDLNNNKVDITKSIIPNLEIRFGELDVTRVVEDGYNYFLTSVGGFKRFMYYNPKLSSWYYYKTNKFARDKKITTEIAKKMVTIGDGTYFCYTDNISLIRKDKNDKYRFLGTTDEDVYYDFNTKDFFYYTDSLQTGKEVITQYIAPYITKEYIYLIEGVCYDNISDVIKGKTDTFIAKVDGEDRIVIYDRNTGNFSYVAGSIGSWNNSKLLTSIHNSVLMVCSNHKNSTDPEIASTISGSKLYLDIYKMKV